MVDNPTSTLAIDYVVVGAGSAGAVIANRLTENPNIRVALIEAGGEAKSFLVEMPAGFAKLVANERFDWCYEQEPDRSINGRRFYWSAGKALGGSSSINGQVYIRGTRRDYDRWAEAGAEGWDFNSVMPFFKRSEHWTGEPSQAHGMTGPLSVSPMRDFHPLCLKFLEGCNEFGLPTLTEYNGGDMEGVFLTVASQRDGWRCSTEKAYLRPARSRDNLQIITLAEVEKIRFINGRAVGVTVNKEGSQISIDAQREVIVCAGAMGTPALLMRSGIGPAGHLRDNGIEIVRDVAGVGQNLQEHPGLSQQRFVNRPTLNSQVGPLDMIQHMVRFLWNRKGPMGAPAVQAMGLARTKEELEEPDVQIHFMPLSYDIEPDTLSAASAKMPKEPTISINASICHPKSRGRVELAPDGRPKIVHQLLGDERDVETLVNGMKLIDRIYASPTISSLVLRPRNPSPIPTSDTVWAEYVRAKVGVTYHPVGTCQMGTGNDCVVDSRLRVKGIEGLRIADASIMPTLPSVNTNATCIMIGEKASELIKADSGLTGRS